MQLVHGSAGHEGFAHHLRSAHRADGQGDAKGGQREAGAAGFSRLEDLVRGGEGERD